MLDLMRNTVAAEREPEMVLGPLEEVARQARGLASVRGEAEETAAAEVTAVLTSVLDRLGAAHHRPFSRS